MANKRLDKIIQTWWNGWIGWNDDAYNYPSSYKMIAMNVPPYDNDGDQSVQKWIPALDSAYHPIANSLNSSYVASVVEWTGALSIKSKSFSFDSNVAKIFDWEIKYGVYINWCIINRWEVPTVDMWVYDDTNYILIAWVNLLAWANWPTAETTIYKKWDVTKLDSSNVFLLSTVYPNSVSTNANSIIEKWVLSNWKKIFVHKVWWQTATHTRTTTQAAVQLTDNSFVQFKADITNAVIWWSVWIVNEDATYVYLQATAAWSSDTKKIDKITWIVTSATLSWAAVTLWSYWTDQGLWYDSSSDWVGYNYNCDLTDTIVKPTDFVNNWLSIDLEINWVVADTITIAADWPAVTNWTISLSDETVWTSNIILDLKTDAAHLGYSKYGFWLTGWTYDAPTGTNDASWDWTAWRDVWANGSYMNIELA